MQQTKYLIIGGGISGTTAAEAIRTADTEGRIVVLEEENNPLYSRVQVPYYLRGIRARDQIFLRTYNQYKENKIEYLVKKTVSSINLAGYEATDSDGETYRYQKLLISTGGKAKRLSKYKNEHLMHTVEDADKILEDLEDAKKGVVVGSGFIALEFLETFLHFGLQASICVKPNGFWSSFLSNEASDCILSILSSKGVTIYKGEEPSFINDTDVFVGVGIGTEITQPFFAATSLKFDSGLEVDSHLRTGVDSVYASGDVAKFYSEKLGRQVRYGNWTNATISGKYAGLNMAGQKLIFDQLSAYSLNNGGLSIVFLGFAGMDEFTETRTRVLSSTECIQFFIRKGKLDGCILINKASERAKFQKIIESREDFIF